jgi:hypothetical protein
MDIDVARLMAGCRRLMTAPERKLAWRDATNAADFLLKQGRIDSSQWAYAREDSYCRRVFLMALDRLEMLTDELEAAVATLDKHGGMDERI